MTPLVIWVPTHGSHLAFNGPGYPPESGSAPVDSPLKVWDGTQWVPAGIKIEE